MTATALPWDEQIAPITGRLSPRGLASFSGSERLRPDGRPRADLRRRLRRIPDLRNAVAVATTLAQPVLVVWAAVTIDHPVAWAAAVLVQGTVFARIAALDHEAAHRLLFSNRRINDLIGINLLGLLTFGPGDHGYRRGHANHHRDEFGPKEPDLGLYARYPLARASVRRKLTRDASGISGWKNLKPVLVSLTRPGRRGKALRTLAGMAFTFSLFALSGHPWLWVVLWFLPLDDGVAGHQPGPGRGRARRHGPLGRSSPHHPRRAPGAAGPAHHRAVQHRLPPRPPRRLRHPPGRTCPSCTAS